MSDKKWTLHHIENNSSVLNVGYQGNVGCRNQMSDFRFRRYFGAI